MTTQKERTMLKRLIMMTTVLSASAAANPAAGIAHEFKMMDADKDGKISSQEHAAGASAMFGKMDADKNGYVTAAEMTAAHKAVTGKDAKKSDMSAQDKIKVADGDGDGKLSAAEHAATSASMFTKMDADQDGLLTEPEMAAGHAAMLKKK
jgi:Ca2+-binding EF-hand superfamily protein